MTESVIARLERVGKVFQGGTTALEDVSLEIETGRFTSIVGPSGCGKSTILRLIAGLAEPSSGRVVRDAQASRIGFVFQEPTLMPWRRVLGNAALPLRLAGQRDAEARARAALAAVGLADAERLYPRQLSGGMKMRVSIARALATTPSLLLMDEPFAALDEITRARLGRDLRRLHHETGLSTVFVTHSVYESVFLSDRVVVMSPRPGRIVADLAIAGPALRDEGFRDDPAYHAQCRAVSAALRVAMGEQALV